MSHFPEDSLRQGNWFKLICGASYQHLPAIRNLALAYTLAGADCLDLAADTAVITAAQEGIKTAQNLEQEAKTRGFFRKASPWLMVSLNDGEDPHFRKAFFPASDCPPACPRPCERACPTNAINFSGVIEELCYGCGRCLPLCPQGLISTRSYVSTPGAIAPLILEKGIDALEIHTQVGHEQDFQRLWQALQPHIAQLKLLSISCQDHLNLINYLQLIYELITPLPCFLVWQTDGRPMSGDLGIGTTRAAVKLAKKVLGANLPGYVQLAGGTNQHTVTKLKNSGMWQEGAKPIAGIAYGSYARSLLSPILGQLETVNNLDTTQPMHLENHPDLLWQAVHQASSLVTQLKTNIDS